MNDDLTLLQSNPDVACDLTEGKYHGWLFSRNADGKWFTTRKMSEFEINQAEDQRDSGTVIHSPHVRR